jgi:hypothetical protein
MSGTVVLAIVLAIVLVVVLAALIRHSGRGGGRDLRRRFGPEYDRLAEQRGDPGAVDRELAERVREHDSLTLQPLSPDERERYVQAWAGAQDRFIDDPRGAARQADQVVTGLLTAIGYPSGDRDRQLALASVDHAYAVNDYRQARELVERSAAADGGGAHAQAADADGGGDLAGSVADPTETLRQAVLHYRVLFKDLLDSAPSTNERAHAGH